MPSRSRKTLASAPASGPVTMRILEENSMTVSRGPQGTGWTLRVLMTIAVDLLVVAEARAQQCYSNHWAYSGTISLAAGGPGCGSNPHMGAGVYEAPNIPSGAYCYNCCPNGFVDVDTFAGGLGVGSYHWYSAKPGYRSSGPAPSLTCSITAPQACNTGLCQNPPPMQGDCVECTGNFVIILYPIDEDPEARTCPRGGGPSPNVGPPTNITNGNVWFDQTDVSMGGVVGLSFVRSYNSANADTTGALGRGWSHSYGRSLSFPPATPKIIKLREDDGEVVYFEDDDTDLAYKVLVPKTETSSIVKAGSTYTRTLRGGGSEVYDLQGRLITLVDAAGNTLAVTRDSSGNMTAITDPGGRSLTLGYDDAGHLSNLSGPNGAIASYSYGQSGLLERVAYSDGSGYDIRPDNNGDVISVTDFSGRVVEEHTYVGGKGVTSSLANGREKFTIEYAGAVSTVTDALGNVTSYTWAAFGGIHRRITKIVGPCQSCGGGGSETQEFTYDDEGRLLTETDGLGHTTTYTYDVNGDRITETNALDETTTFTYDAQGRVLTRTGPDGALTTYTYGPSGPLTITEKVTATQNRTTTITYNGQGKPASITDPRSKTTVLAYNAPGDLTSVTDPLSHATTFTYDGLGRRTTVTDALSHTTTTDYDSRGRVTQITNHDSTHTDFGYDKGGRRTSVTDPLGRVMQYAYDPYGRLEAVIDPLNGQTRYAYDLMSNLTSLTDAKGQMTSFEYDGYNRVKKVIYPGGAFETFSYDAGGRLATKTDRKSVVTTYAYDDLGRLTGKTYSDATPAVSYTYDAGGRLMTAANGTDTLTWTYDLAGQLLNEQSTKNSSTVAYTYDDGGNRLSVSLDGQVFVTYAYDDASRLTTITRGSNVFGFGYDNANRRTSMTYPNGVNTSYAYDTLDRLTNLSAVKAPTTVTNFTYAYDATGNRTSKQQLDFTEAYSYDKLYRLTGVERTGGSTGRWLYSYDAVGNRLSEQIDDAVSSSTYNEKNQLLSSAAGGPVRWRGTLNEPGNVAFTAVSVNGQPARMLAGNVFEADLQMTPGNNTVTVQATDVSGNVTTKNYQANVTGSGATYSYDLNGNLIQKVEGSETWGYEWNAKNQLTRVTKNAVEQARFIYDPLGRRVEKVAGGVTTNYTYESDDIQREGNGSTTLKYVHGPGIDEPLAADDGSSLTYFQTDSLGSVVKNTSSTGSVTLTRQYDAWGNIQVGTTTPGYAFTSREWDPEAGIHYNRARYYDPRMGRFTREDPIGFRGGDVNLYGYVRNNPANLTDPTGLAYIPNVVINCDSQPYLGFGEPGPNSSGQVLVILGGVLPGNPGVTPPWWDIDFICTPCGWRKIKAGGVIIGGAVAGSIDPPTDWKPPFDCPKEKRCSGK